MKKIFLILALITLVWINNIYSFNIIDQGGTGTGDVVGPAVSIDNTIPRYDSTTGKLLQGSGIVIDDTDHMTFNNAAAPAILSSAATSTVPTLIPNKADLDTGIGWAAANALSLTAGATEGLRITQTPIAAGQTVASLTHTKTAVLGKDTTNEVAYTLNYTTNKAAGNDTGLLINKTNTLSPGASWLFDTQVDGVSKIKGLASGLLYCSGVEPLTGASFTMTSSNNAAAQPSLLIYGVETGNSIAQQSVKINSLLNQSGTAAQTDLLIDRTETAVGSGEQYLTQLQVGSANIGMTTNKGHIIVDDAVALTYPALTTCGTSPVLVAGSTDRAGTLTMGATGTGCVITFGTAYTNTPSCIVQAETVANLTSYTLSTTAITIVGSPGNFNYICTGINGGI